VQNNANKTDKTMKWAVAASIGIAVILGILWFRAHMNAHIAYLNESYCRWAEQDADKIAAEITDYFSNPEHTTLPTIRGDSRYLGYVLNSREGQNIAWVTGDPESTITIVVQDGSGQCPDDYQKRSSQWDSGKYTRKLGFR